MNTNTTRLSRRNALRLLGFAGAAALLRNSKLHASATAGAEPDSPRPAPDLTGPQPGYFRFAIGDMDAVSFSDGGFGGPLDQAPWPGEARAKLARDLAEAFLPPAAFALPFNVLLVRIGSELVLVDSGAGALFGPAGGKLVARMASIGVRPEQVSAVILTHAHGDHFGGLLDPETNTPTFSQAQHFIHRREYEFWTGSAPDLSATAIPPAAQEGSIVNARRCLETLRAKWQFVSPGDRIIEGLEIIDAPGHTPGHIALHFTSGDSDLLHFVDAAHHHAISFANPDIPFAYDVLPQVAVETRHRLLDRAAAERTRVYGAHMPFPALGHVRRTGASYEHVIEPWPV